MPPDLPDSGSESETDRIGHRLRSSMGQEGIKLPKKPKAKRRDMPERKKKWLDARDRFMEEAENEAFTRDKKMMYLLDVPLKDIKYADTPEDAEILAAMFLDAFARRRRNHYLVGFDSEGELDTVQLFTRLDGRRYAVVLQLNFIF